MRWFAGHGLDEGGAGKDEEKAGQKGDVGGDQGAEHAGGQRGEIPGQVPGPHESHILGHHDQRAGGRFGQAKADEHLLGAEPAVAHGDIGDVGQHGIGTTEGDEGRLGEKKAIWVKVSSSPRKAHTPPTTRTHRPRQMKKTRTTWTKEGATFLAVD